MRQNYRMSLPVFFFWLFSSKVLNLDLRFSTLHVYLRMPWRWTLERKLKQRYELRAQRTIFSSAVRSAPISLVGLWLAWPAREGLGQYTALVGIHWQPPLD